MLDRPVTIEAALQAAEGRMIAAQTAVAALIFRPDRYAALAEARSEAAAALAEFDTISAAASRGVRFAQ